MAGISAQGLTFTFGGSALIITNVSVNDSQDLIDGSHLGIPASGRREYVGGFATDREVSCDVIYNSSASLVVAGTSGALSITGPLSFSGNATVQSSSISGSVGDIVKGQITLKVA